MINNILNYLYKLNILDNIFLYCHHNNFNKFNNYYHIYNILHLLMYKLLNKKDNLFIIFNCYKNNLDKFMDNLNISYFINTSLLNIQYIPYLNYNFYNILLLIYNHHLYKNNFICI